MSRLQFRLLGAFQIEADDSRKPVFRTRKTKALAAVLCRHLGQWQSRAFLAALLWGYSDESQARKSLRQALSLLRNAFSEYDGINLEAGPDGIRLAARPDSIDVVQFDAFAGSNEAEALEQALAQYRGPFLDGFDIREEGFRDWLGAERRLLHEKAVRATAKLLDHKCATQKTECAIELAEHFLHLEPLHEPAHRKLISLYLEEGRYGAAIRHFESYRDQLQNELGLLPSEELSKLIADTRDTRQRQARTARLARAATQVHQGPCQSHSEDALPLPSIVITVDSVESDRSKVTLFANAFADGLSTSLSKYRWLAICGFGSVQIGAEENGDGRYQLLLRPYVRDNRIRVYCSLICRTSQLQLWSHAYDCSTDVQFEDLDEIAHRAAATIGNVVERSELRRAISHHDGQTNSWAAYLIGLSYFHKHTKDGNKHALDYFEHSTKLDPAFGLAMANAAYAKFHNLTDGYSKDRPRELADAFALAERAVMLDETDAFSHFVHARLLSFSGQMDRAIHQMELAIELNPAIADIYHGLGFALTYSARCQDAVSFFQKASTLSPYDPNSWAFEGIRCVAFIGMENFDDAITSGQRATLRPNAKYWAWSHLASALGHAGNKHDARRVLKELIIRKPDFELSFAKEHLSYYEDRHMLDHYLAGLKQAGLS